MSDRESIYGKRVGGRFDASGVWIPRGTGEFVPKDYCPEGSHGWDFGWVCRILQRRDFLCLLSRLMESSVGFMTMSELVEGSGTKKRTMQSWLAELRHANFVQTQLCRLEARRKGIGIYYLTEEGRALCEALGLCFEALAESDEKGRWRENRNLARRGLLPSGVGMEDTVFDLPENAEEKIDASLDGV
jgi:hypothetical protein